MLRGRIRGWSRDRGRRKVWLGFRTRQAVLGMLPPWIKKRVHTSRYVVISRPRGMTTKYDEFRNPCLLQYETTWPTTAVVVPAVVAAATFFFCRTDRW